MKSPVYDSYAGKQVTVSHRGVNPPNRIAIAFVFFGAMSVSARSQVVLHLNSLHFNAYEPIKVTAINRGSRTISVCVSQQWISKPNDDVGVATTPLLLQGQRDGKWVTVLNGVDVGHPLRYPLTIEPRKAEKYQLQTSGSGKARFVLYYWIGDDINACDSPSGHKKAVSPTFTLAARQQQ